jgi:membrane protein DedA with SNARE-associated domain
MGFPTVLASSAPLPGFLHPVAGLVDHYGYAVIALFLLLENIGVPVIPGELSMIAGAIFAGTGRAGLNVVAVGVIAVACSFAGAEVGYAIGRSGGRALVLRHGRYVLMREHHLDRAEAAVAKYGGPIVVFARFIVGLRELNGIIAGVSGMQWLRFTAYNAVGAVAWVAAWVSAGYLAGGHIEAIYKDASRYSVYLLIALAVLLSAYVLSRLSKRHRRRATVPTEEPGGGSRFS